MKPLRSIIIYGYFTHSPIDWWLELTYTILGFLLFWIAVIADYKSTIREYWITAKSHIEIFDEDIYQKEDTEKNNK